MRSLTLIGAGRLGKSLAKLFINHQQFLIKNILDSSVEAAEAAVEFIGKGKAVTRFEDVEESDFYLVAVPDDCIGDVAKKLIDLPQVAEKVVFHCSGALSSEILGEGNFLKASIHPVKSFADPALAINDFSGTWCGVEGDEDALQVLEPIFSEIGGNCFRINGEFKKIYHAGAVFASNFLPLLIESSLKCYEESGVDRELAMKIIEPICRLTLENVIKLGPQNAVTGPVARGDFASVDNQREELEKYLPEIADLYKKLSDDLANLVIKSR